VKNIIATISVSPQTFPPATIVGPYRLAIAGPRTESQDVAYTGSAVSATFADVPDGIYTVTAELLDSAGVLLGNQLSTQVTVQAQPTDIILQVPAGLTVQVITA